MVNAIFCILRRFEKISCTGWVFDPILQLSLRGQLFAPGEMPCKDQGLYLPGDQLRKLANPELRKRNWLDMSHHTNR